MKRKPKVEAGTVLREVNRRTKAARRSGFGESYCAALTDLAGWLESEGAVPADPRRDAVVRAQARLNEAARAVADVLPAPVPAALEDALSLAVDALDRAESRRKK